MDKGRYSAERLVRTECKYFANQGELMGYKENGIKRYRFIAVEDAVAGINYPPIHPNCLCIVVADFDKGMFNRKIDTTPLAENIKFQEWRRKYAT